MILEQMPHTVEALGAARAQLGPGVNIAENELSAMTRQCLRRRRIGDLATLHAEVSAWSTDTNGTQRGVDWQMKVDDARCKLKSVYPKILV